MTTCSVCQTPLTLEIEPEEEEKQEEDEDQNVAGPSNSKSHQTVPDDVELACGCHYHWQCLLDAYQSPNCPTCTRLIISASPSGAEQVLCNLNNEGGLQTDLDILPVLAEESYLKSYPKERKCRAFLEFCREGDVEAIVELLKDTRQDDDEDDEEDDDNEEGDSMEFEGTTSPRVAIDILRYQDPLGSMYSGLHLAVIHNKPVIIWLLLFLASQVNLDLFPHEVLQAAEESDLTEQRKHRMGGVDIRALRDADGRTAVQHANGGSIGSDLIVLIAPPGE
ncbi:MAG: hypothetical protein Q9187_002743 [Circinaria calcarea]